MTYTNIIIEQPFKKVAPQEPDRVEIIEHKGFLAFEVEFDTDDFDHAVWMKMKFGGRLVERRPLP